MLQDTAITYTTNHIASVVNKGQYGTSATIASSTDGGLISPDASTLVTSSNSISSNQIIFSFQKLSTVGVGSTYSEVGVRDIVNNVNWTRYVFTPLLATSYEDWTTKIRLFVRSI